MLTKWIYGGLILALLASTAAPLLAAEKKMTREEYQATLAEYTQREEKAKADIEQLDTDMASLNRQIEALDAEIASIQKEIYRLVDATEVETQAYDSKLDGLIRQLEGLMSLAPEDLFRRRSELEEISRQLKELKSDKISALPEMAEKIAQIKGMLNQLLDRAPRQMSIPYTVKGGDNLWNIAKKEKIYADPFMWPRIYRANRDQIQDPDLIYPKQVFEIPHGVGENQHLVMRGDFLYSIASWVYNDPTKWHKIYQANKAQIVDPNLVFPAQLLDIPTN